MPRVSEINPVKRTEPGPSLEKGSHWLAKDWSQRHNFVPSRCPGLSANPFGLMDRFLGESFLTKARQFVAVRVRTLLVYQLASCAARLISGARGVRRPYQLLTAPAFVY
jgi:hypothetical protein